MSRLFAQLDHRETHLGKVTLRRRREPILDVDVWEVMLGDEHLMSSIFTAGETALATLALAAVEGSSDTESLDVVVGGLGLGYTAVAALADVRVGRVDVIEALDVVIDWHHASIVPNGEALAADQRCHLVHGDFFAAVAADGPLVADGPERVHAVLLDIDHTPSHHLAADHAWFYGAEGLGRLAQRLHPGGASGSGRTDTSTRSSSPCCGRCSPTRSPTRSASRITTPGSSRPTPSTWLAGPRTR